MFSVDFHKLSKTCKLGVGGSELGSVRVCGIVCKDGEGLQTESGAVGVRWGGVWQKTEGVASEFLVCSKVHERENSSIGPVT